MRCCINSVIYRWCRDPCIHKLIPRRKRILKKFGERVAEIQMQHPDRRLQVYHEDEARFGQQGTMTRVWVRTGSRPRVVRQTQSGFVDVLAARCAQTGQAEGLIAPRLDTGIVHMFLAQLSRRLEPVVQAVLVWDGAGYHRSHDLKCPSNGPFRLREWQVINGHSRDLSFYSSNVSLAISDADAGTGMISYREWCVGRRRTRSPLDR